MSTPMAISTSCSPTGATAAPVRGDAAARQLWLNDGAAHFTDVTAERMPQLEIGFSLGPRPRRRRQRLGPRRPRLLQGLRGQPALPQRRHRHLHRRDRRQPPRIHEQLRVRADRPRRRRVPGPRHDQRRPGHRPRLDASTSSATRAGTFTDATDAWWPPDANARVRRRHPVPSTSTPMATPTS